MHKNSEYPSRIACLSTETVEVLYALGQQDRIVGISGFTVWPLQARREKPKISGFSTANVDKILAVKPDLVLSFSNLQADIVKDCIRAGLSVHVFNQRDIAGIYQMIATLGRLTGAQLQADALIQQLQNTVEEIRLSNAEKAHRPKVYFEEWNEPMITSVRWVSQLIEIAGGINVFDDVSKEHAASQRVVNGEQVLQAKPDVIVASWCGKKFNESELVERPGWCELPAVRNGQVFEIKSAEILSPGISAITRGLPRLVDCLSQWRERNG